MSYLAEPATSKLVSPPVCDDRKRSRASSLFPGPGSNFMDRASRLDPGRRRESMISTMGYLSGKVVREDSDLRDSRQGETPDPDDKMMQRWMLLGRKDRRRSSGRLAYSFEDEEVKNNLAKLAEKGLAKGSTLKPSTLPMFGGNQLPGMSSLINVRKNLKKKAQELRRRKLYAKFRSAVKLVIILYRMCRIHYQDVGQDREKLTFAQLDISSDNLIFDVTQYKANKAQRISQDAKRILKMVPSERKEQDVYYVTIALRGVRSIAEYPIRMQRSVARVGWYEEYEAKRVIVREGHAPQSFYFILAGSAVVTVMDKGGDNINRTVAILKKGDSFGELAILNRSNRTSTVTAREKLEMFCISVADYTRIFMAGGTRNLNDPDHNSFITGISFLKGWPLNLLSQNPKSCMFHYFKRDLVLVKDSKYCDWIYIVKSGSCSVLKKLKEPNLKMKQKHKKRTVFGNYSRSLVSKRVVEKLKYMDHETLILENEWEVSEKRKQRKRPVDDVEKEVLTLKPSEVEGENNGATDGEIASGEEVIDVSGGKDSLFQIKRQKSLVMKGPFRSRQGTAKKTIADNNNNTVVGSNNRERVRTIVDDLNAGYRERELTEADLHPVFVRVQTLVKGGVFGLHELLFDEQPSLSIVSNGAECIVISKRFFMEHATDQLLTRIRHECVPYDDDENMQRNLVTQLYWDKYCKITLKKAAAAVKKRQQAKKRLFR